MEFVSPRLYVAQGLKSKGGRCEAAPEFKVIYKNVLVAIKDIFLASDLA